MHKLNVIPANATMYIDEASTSVKHMYMFHVKTIIYINPFCTQLEVTRKEASKEFPQKKWMDQLENLTQERDRLTGDVMTLKDQLVAMKREVKYLILIW